MLNEIEGWKGMKKHINLGGLPWWLRRKEFACSAGDPGSVSGLRRSPGEKNGYPPQYSCPENSVVRGAWWAIVHGVAESDTTE